MLLYTMAGLDQLLGKLDIDGERGSKEDAYSEQLKATEFSIFSPVKDLGYFSWKADGDYKALSNIKSEEEILRYIQWRSTQTCAGQ